MSPVVINALVGLLNVWVLTCRPSRGRLVFECGGTVE